MAAGARRRAGQRLPRAPDDPRDRAAPRRRGLALDVPFTLGPANATDSVEERLELGSLPGMLTLEPHLRDLLGPGRTVHLHATGTAEGTAERVVDLTGDTLMWRRTHEKCAVAVRSPLTEIVLTIYRRQDPDDAEVLGDVVLLRDWLAANPFG